MYMRRFMLFRLKEHLDDNSIKSYYLWHILSSFLFMPQIYSEYL